MNYQEIGKEHKSRQFLKKGDKTDPNNYRPVSLTSILCKVLEGFIRDSIQKFFDDLNLYTTCQHGFRRKRSCVSQLLEVMEDFTDFLDKGEAFDTIYLDFRKAFDSVPHERLLLKLEAYGISGQIIMWIRNFLINREQTVRVGKDFSETSRVLSGIPQGSILGPVLFTIFINDLPEGIESFCKIFADDTKVYNTTKNAYKIQDDLNKIQEWSDKWQLPFNVGKCKCMHYGPNNPEHSYTLYGTDINTCTQEKDLGVTFDPSLKFKIHIQNVINKGNQILALIRKNFMFMDRDTLVQLYKAMVRPHLEYGNTIWSPRFKEDIKSLEKVQKRATKLLPGLKNLSYEDRLKLLKLPSLKYRRMRGDLIQVFNIMNTEDANSFFIMNNQESTRGHNLKIFKPQAKLDAKKYAFSHRVVEHWNKLPYDVVNSKNINDFKNKLDNFYGNKIYEYDELNLL